MDIYSDDGDDGERRRGYQERKLTRRSRPIFDSKAAKDELPQHNGRDGLAMWAKKVSFYLYSRCCVTDTIFKWIEKQSEPVSHDVLREACSHMPELIHDPTVVSFHLWGWPGINLKEDAWSIYESVLEKGNGFEVWRLLTADITQRTLAERLNLEDAFLTPPRIKDIR